MRTDPVQTPADRRWSVLVDMLTAGDPAASLVQRIGEVSADLLGVSGAGMCLVGGAEHQIIVHGTDRLAEELEDLQITLGEGPCIESVRTGVPVLVDDLRRRIPTAWPRLARQALDRGVRALFSFPLLAGSMQLGALDLYRSRPGPLTPGQAADASMLAEIASRSMLAQQDRLHLDDRVGALEWLTGRHGTQRRAVDLGITVGEAIAASPWGRVDDPPRAPSDPDGDPFRVSRGSA